MYECRYEGNEFSGEAGSRRSGIEWRVTIIFYIKNAGLSGRWYQFKLLQEPDLWVGRHLMSGSSHLLPSFKQLRIQVPLQAFHPFMGMCVRNVL